MATGDIFSSGDAINPKSDSHFYFQMSSSQSKTVEERRNTLYLSDFIKVNFS